MTRSTLVNVMMGAAEKATKALIRDFGELEHLQVSQKGTGDFVSAADLRVEKILRTELSKARPDFGFLMEESGSIEGREADIRWIVDPIDGTSNFIHGIPHFAISIALEKRGEIIACLTLDPIKQEAFWAEKGMGAYINDRRIRTSARHVMSEALVATGLPFAQHGEDACGEALKPLLRMMPQVAGIRRFGAATLDLAYVAAGRFDAFWENGLSPWDMAAGILLVKEAGGRVVDKNGGNQFFETKSIIATNQKLSMPIRETLRQPA